MLHLIRERLAKLEALKNDLVGLMNEHNNRAHQYAVQIHQTSGAIAELQVIASSADNVSHVVGEGLDVAKNVVDALHGDSNAILAAAEQVADLVSPEDPKTAE